jgi:hypothetical protein
MLNNMVASFTASNQVGEAMKKGAKKLPEKKNDFPTENYGDNDSPEVV